MVNGSCGFIISWVVAIHSVKGLSLAVRIEDTESDCKFGVGKKLSYGPLICYTCVNVSNNFVCNQYAVDVPCAKGDNFCYTLHIMDSTGTSVVVNKKCANSSECWSSGVGCFKIDSQTICVSCCDELYCNVTVPTNQSEATLSRKRPSNRSANKVAANSDTIISNTSWQLALKSALILLARNM